MNQHPDTSQKPFYKKGRFYLISISGAIGFLLLILLVSIFIMRWYNPDFTRFTLREDWSQFSSEAYSLRDNWVASEDIPEHMKWAVVASEDQLFWEHNGFDMESIREAWEERQSGERNRGASTISQQVAKNLFLSPAHSFFRKGVEAAITVLIELFWPKERIMEVYLNIAEFGPGIYGIGFASEQYWGISAQELTPEMSSRLAAVLPSPKRMRVEPPSPFAEERSHWILRQMTQLSGIAYYQPEEPEEEEFDDIDPYLLERDFEAETNLRIDRDDTTDTTSYTSDSSDIDSLQDSLSSPVFPDTTLSAPQQDSIRTDSVGSI